MENEDRFDVAVIGGGPAGIMSAIVSAESGKKVILIEANNQLGKKLLLTGNGRCNVTNAEFNLRELVKNYKNGEFLFHAFSKFGPKETLEFFEKIGIETKIEKNKRVFPKNGDAEDVLEALKKYLKEKNVKIILNSKVSKIVLKKNKIEKMIVAGKEIFSKNYILCTGGKSYSVTGSTGDGFNFAEQVGHSITKLLPALTPIKLKDEWIKNLQGVSLPNVKISLFNNGKKQINETGDIIFTHFGISGPVVMDISSKLAELLDKGETKILLDFFPLLNQEEVLKELEDILKRFLKRTTKNILTEMFPESFSEVLLDLAKIDKEKIANNMSKIEKIKLVKLFKNLEITPIEVSGFDVAMATSGGINLKEIDDKTMKSKIIDNLLFAGEIIDVDGKTGGFNLQACWSTGYLAGKNAL